MFKVNMADIYGAEPIFAKILGQEFTAAQSFKICKFMKIISSELEDFNKTREKLILKYAEKDGQGQLIINDGNVKIEEKEINNFQKEVNELLTLEIELACDKIPIDWLSNLKITPREMMAIEPFIE